MICLFTQAGFSCYKPTNEVFGLSVHDNHEARRVDGGKYDAVTESTPSIMSPTRGRRARQMLDSLLTHLLSRLLTNLIEDTLQKVKVSQSITLYYMIVCEV